MDIPHMVAHMIASCVRDMPGVVASGSTKEGSPLVFIAMSTDKGYAMTIVHVAEFAAPNFVEYYPEAYREAKDYTSLLSAARAKYGAICPECNVPWQTPSPNCPHREFNLHPLAHINPHGPIRETGELP